MIMERFMGGRLRGLAPALALALVVNLAVFCLAPMLLQGGHGLRTRKAYRLEPIYLPPPPPPPPPEELKETPPPPPPVVQPLGPDKPTPVQPNLEAPPPLVTPAPGLTTGLAVAPPGPLRFEMGQVDRPPTVTGRVPPLYPYHARRQGLEGSVKVRFLVDVKGRVRQPKVIAARPPGVFEDAVLDSLPRWRFQPGYLGGRPVETWVETTINFRLEQK